ncbi:MAG: type IV pilus assembly protein PilM [Candidatus Gastranaerophilales bacterium]|nr:type IV pilus assembly protein PilM [Candidatus Gastranaerophilales bacterium]
MLKLFQKTRKPEIGLEISPEGICAVLLEKNKNCTLKCYAYEPFPAYTIENGLIVNYEAFTDTLKKHMDNTKFDTKIVNIAVPSNVAFIKTITLPDLPLNELKVIVPQEALKHIPFPLNEINIDFEVIENSKKTEDSVKKVDIILVALAKSIAKNYIDLISSTGFIVNSIDITPFASIRTLANAGYIDNSDSLFISTLIDYEHTDINILHKGMPVFSNSIPLGKKNIIDLLSGNLEIDNVSAEKLLPEIALVVPGINIDQPDPQLNRAAAAIRPIFSNITSEIQKTIEFYNSKNSENKIFERIIVSGSGACIQNIDKYFTNKLKIETLLCNSFKNIDHDLETNEHFIYPVNLPALSTSLGLALKGFES